MIDNFITSALVIDDDKSEVESLIGYLEEKDIWTKYFHPDDLKSKLKPFNNRKLIFLDLYLDDSKSSTENIAQIRKYFDKIIGQNFGTYGIVLWTKHTNHFEDFCNKIFLPSNRFDIPLFIIPLDKTKYKAQGNYEGVLDELYEKLKEDVSSALFVEWNEAVKSGSDSTIKEIYGLLDNNTRKSKNLEFILYQLALNHTGIPKLSTGGYDLQKDLIKSLMDPLQFEISSAFKPINSLFANPSGLNFNEAKEVKELIYSKLNTILMLDSHNLSQSTPIPGNIYEILDNNSPLNICELLDKENNEILFEVNPDFMGKNIRKICIELTPPCDFSMNKKQKFSRIVGGVQLDNDQKLLNAHFKKENYYTFLNPVYIDGYGKPQMIIFDFYRFQTLKETELIDKKKFKIIYRAKNRLFADILQKFSSHTARLGIGVLQ